MEWLPKDAWWACTAIVTGGSTSRSPDLLNRIIDQFDLSHERYQPKPEGTKCNILVWDVTRALACEIPQRELIAGQLTQLNANGMYNWLNGPRAREQRWNEVTEQVARARADAGFPVVVAQYNPGGPGHMAVGRPAPSDSDEQDGRLWIAQAGGKNLRFARPSDTFLPHLPKRFYFHE
jgi:hypothetical protein